jgi:hypothetical protein
MIANSSVRDDAACFMEALTNGWSISDEELPKKAAAIMALHMVISSLRNPNGGFRESADIAAITGEHHEWSGEFLDACQSWIEKRSASQNAIFDMLIGNFLSKAK